MRLLKVEATNFGSYKDISFDYTNQGLTLIQGPTGSGKSTFQDLPAWILFGITAKDGNVDEVRSWQTPDEPTEGSITLEVGNSQIKVTRIRGKSTQNDLYWQEGDSEDKTRGKDITDTQKLLNKRLGVSPDLYTTASYFHEFSSTALFFVANAKTRRQIFENIANLDFPNKLAARAQECKKELKPQIADLQTKLTKETGALEQIILQQQRQEQKAKEWDKKHKEEIESLKARHEGFETEKQSKIQALMLKSERFEQTKSAEIDKLLAKIDKLTEVLVTPESVNREFEEAKSQITRCDKCGSVTGDMQEHLTHLMVKKTNNDKNIEKFEELKQRLKELYEQENPNEEAIEETKKWANPYGDSISAKISESNPYRTTGKDADLEGAKGRLSVLESTISGFNSRYSALDELSELALTLRAELLKNTIKGVESKTNQYLETHFDGEFRISLTPNDDNLDVSIYKNGYECVYKQLSKGQRQMLKLCFVLSVMSAASNNAGINFNTLFFDEALDGLDSELKTKAFGLFESLATQHESIFLIDHNPEFQSLFSNRYLVSLNGDYSQIEHE